MLPMSVIEREEAGLPVGGIIRFCYIKSFAVVVVVVMFLFY